MLINLFWLSAPKPLKVTLYIGPRMAGALCRSFCQRPLLAKLQKPGIACQAFLASQSLLCSTRLMSRPQVLPYTPQMKQALGPTGAWLVAAGGIAYTVGADHICKAVPGSVGAQHSGTLRNA